MGAMTGTTDGTGPRGPGYSVRVRITAAVAALVTIALAGAGLIVYVIEVNRVEASVQREVEQELDEFAKLEEGGVDPESRSTCSPSWRPSSSATSPTTTSFWSAGWATDRGSSRPAPTRW